MLAVAAATAPAAPAAAAARLAAFARNFRAIAMSFLRLGMAIGMRHILLAGRVFARRGSACA